MSARVEWRNLAEFRFSLQTIAPKLREDAKNLIDDATTLTGVALYENYPRGETGNLRAGIRVTKRATDLLVENEVRSTAPHAILWEYGTQNRETKKHWNRGRMKSAKERGFQTLRSIASRYSRGLMRELAALTDLSKVAA